MSNVSHHRLAAQSLWLLLFLLARGATGEESCTVSNDPAQGCDPTQLVTALLHARAADAYPDAQIDVRVSAFDNRLVLGTCDDLTATPRGRQVVGRIPVALKCTSPVPWSAFLSGDVRVEAPVLVATAPLPRGTMLTAGDFETKTHDISRLRSMPLRDPDQVIGQQLKRSLDAGSVLYLSQIERPLAVRRGEKVTVMAIRGSVRIAAPGESLENGRRGEQIRVVNRQSGKTIEVWVVDRGLVQTTAPALPGSAPVLSLR